MAARNDSINIPAGTWTRATLDPVTSLRLQNMGGYTIKIQATTDTTAPTGIAGAIDLLPYKTITGDILLADLFAGVTTGTGHVWVFSDVGTVVSVSHA